MKKIISLFQRNYDGDRLIRNEATPGAEWVLAGKGIPTRKFDGTACMVKDGKLYKRCKVKRGGRPPANFEPANEADETTGEQQGWVRVGNGLQDQWHREAFARGLVRVGKCTIDDSGGEALPDGTYELCGPKVQGNPEFISIHCLIPHGCIKLDDAPRDFDGLKAYLAQHDIEGIVWWQDLKDPDCDKVKIKGKDFRLKRGR